jgi:hypothetical protein
MSVTPLNPFAEDSAPTGAQAPEDMKPGPATTKRMTARERKDQREHNELVAVLNSEEGRAVIGRILDRCKPYTPNTEADAFRQGIREGQRQIGTWLIGAITRVDPVGYSKLLEDRAQRLEKARTEEALISEREDLEREQSKPLHRLAQWGKRLVNRVAG